MSTSKNTIRHRNQFGEFAQVSNFCRDQLVSQEIQSLMKNCPGKIKFYSLPAEQKRDIWFWWFDKQWYLRYSDAHFESSLCCAIEWMF